MEHEQQVQELNDKIHTLQHEVADSKAEQSVAMQNELVAYRNLIPYLLIERDALRSKLQE